ncbi:hypothetical protein F0402_09085 [Mycolicibacter arupensis]|nr:hypothetical protein F0402_09085 [Mycolicibacter arupensis]
MNVAAAWSAIALLATVLAFRWRRSAPRLCGVVLAVGTAFAVTFLLGGPSAPYIFERAAAVFAGTIIVSILAVLVVTQVLPRLRAGGDRWPAAALCAMLAVSYGAVALMMWRIADDGLQFRTLPEARSGNQILAWRNSPPRHRIYGVLVEARLGELPAAEASSGVPSAEQRTLLSSYQCTRVGPFRPTDVTAWFPSRLSVTFSDGSTAPTSWISSVRQAWKWPSSGRRLTECGLRVGDPVVIWGDPGAVRAQGSDRQQPAVNAVQMVAYGDIATFRDQFGPAAERTGRATLILAGLNGVLAIAMGAIGLRTYWRLTRAGTDVPPRISWRRA